MKIVRKILVVLASILLYIFPALLLKACTLKSEETDWRERYEQVCEENEILWGYVENIDTYQSLDDAVEFRDRLYEIINDSYDALPDY